MNRICRLTPIVAAMVLVSGCGAGLPRPPGRALPVFRPDPGQVLFQVEYQGSGAPGVYLGARPSVTVYGNGDAYVIPPGARSRYPVVLNKGAVPAATLRELVAEANGSGLFDHADYGSVHVMDAGDTSIVFRPDRAAARTAQVYALDSDDDTLSWRQRGNRAALRAFEQRLTNSVAKATAWVPSRVDITAVPGNLSGAGNPPMPWPGPPLPTLLAAHVQGRCGVLSGPDARAVFSAARRHPFVRWLDGGTAYALAVRALLPVEPACGD